MTMENLISYVVQAGVVLVVGLLAPRIFRLKSPAWSLRYWQVLLAAVLLLPLLQPWRIVDAGAAAVDVVASGVVGRVTTSVPGVAGLTLLQWGLLAVAAVAAVRLTWLFVGLLVLRGYRRKARPFTGLEPAFDDLTRREGLHADVLVSDDVHAPVTFGWRRPTILVPRGFENLPRGQQKGITCHELLHVERRDWPILVSEQILRAVLWFHPAVHILLGRIGLSREQLIDREVVRITGHRRQYLDALWTMARARQGRAFGPALFLLNRSDLFERVALLAEEAHMSKKRITGLAIAAVVAVVASGAFAASLFPFTKIEAVASSPAPAARSVAVEDPGEEVRHPVRYVEDGELSEPKVIHKVNPRYPEEARKEKIQGVVVCEAIIDINGKVVDPKVLESAHDVLEQPTIDALEQWTFEPSRNSDGEAVDVLYEITIRYRLQ